MNLNIVQKLIKLANNNSNENEANLAARKVCKMLTDYKFSQSTSNVRAGEAQTKSRSESEKQQQHEWNYQYYGHGKAWDINPKEPRFTYNECVQCGSKYPIISNESPIKNFVCAYCQVHTEKKQQYKKWTKGKW